ncbi:intraflagellar transport protein 20 homolog [Teleopsis dalmanni]|uniref:intraflagellar transport protein 20 homolog n=1 Tax=Teleopsis dalmanni TaxID=139649 RepID=UPI0018CCECA5|nr:intraflagellar transport protein 20 homolog [Teleopsis dalmanni]
MSEELQKAGLYIDDIYRLRVQDPRIATETNELREECLEYANKLQEFKKLAADFHKIVSKISKDVEREKLRAIGTQNILKTIAQQRQAEQQVYQSKIHEKNTELDRLKSEYQYLQRIEAEQQETINNFLLNQ